MGFPTVYRGATTEQLATVLDRINKGKFNATVDFTITANASTSTIVDQRIAPTSAIILDPMTANAAQCLASGNCYILGSDRSNGSAIMTHANNAQTDRTFRVLIIG
jgi:hypothetical protein